MKMLSVLFLLSSFSYAQVDKEMMKKFEAASTPGEHHKDLGAMEGKWETSSKMWESADSKPQESKGKATFKMIMGGRYLKQEMSGKAMGQNYDGLGLIGYNNVLKKYETIWIDNISTAMTHGHGEMDVATKTLKEKGEYTCPMTENPTQEYRSDFQLLDKKKMIFSMYGKGPKGGAEFKMMEITYTRK